ncbi:LOW QUALITY PROTEIN: 5-hydroxytryptamine receptor 1 [Daphnia magna]|uniref:LOW QUALITY PROTEIN: 5-hydroxytryptamine receptor 1 n=1 Tax=Daphnia magna TaxID=35525 RepID=UPI001E1BAF53|nr:LOW QUALITY PROTEIN: 5-hydroxytryptamine receptor 1 [Daphnia magna]
MDSAGQWNVHLMTIGDTINNQTSYYSSSSDDGRTAGFATPTAMNYSLMETVLISAALLAIIVGTVVGNVLVCIAVCLVRRLRRPCNYLLVSLAVSDLCVALLVMPMALVYEVLGTWPFGATACDTWVAFDVLSCTASILNLCMISVDRYWAITRPLDYGVKRTPARMISCVALVWISSACISLPPLLVLGNEHGPVSTNNSHHQPIEEDSFNAGQDLQCQVCQEFGYQIYATLGSFYIPLAVMAAVYYQIFQAAKRIVDEEKKAQSHLLMTRTNSCPKSGQEKCKSKVMNPVQSSLLVHPYPTSVCDNAALIVVRRHSDQQLQTSNRRDNPPATDQALTNNEMWSKDSNGGHPVTWPDTASKPQEQTNNTTMSSTVDIALKSTGTTINRTEGQRPPSKRRRSNQLTHRRGSRVRLRFALNKERKASTTLGIIMSAFTLCWFPFFVLALVRPFMSHQTASLVIPRWLSSLFLWLGYANSFLNPVIYATTNKDFRLPFREILCLRCKSLNSVMREEFYQSQYGNNQQPMDTTANNNKSGLMAGHQASSPSSSSSTSHPKVSGNRRRRRRCSTESVGMEQNNRKIGNAATEEDDATDYGLMTAGHRESSSSATAFL